MKSSKPLAIEKRFNAFLWDGINRLEGEIRIFEQHLDFDFKDFPSSHINLEIPFEKIQKIEDFKVFGLANNGIKIHSIDGKVDCFVLGQSSSFKQILSQKPNNHSK